MMSKLRKQSFLKKFFLTTKQNIMLIERWVQPESIHVELQT